MSEESIHNAVCQYLKLQYPKVLFNTDLSGIKLTPGQANKVARLRSGKGWPDIFIVESRNGYYGLFIELKAKSIWLKKGGIIKTKHLIEQQNMLTDLKGRGYIAVFACGFEEAKRVIDEYLK